MISFDRLSSLLFSDGAHSMMAKIQRVYARFPHLPQFVTRFLVRVVPWTIVVGGALWLLTGFVLFVLGLFSILTFDVWVIVSTLFESVFALANAYLMLHAFAYLKKKQHEGWVYLWWTTLLSVVASFVALFGDGNLLTALTSSLLSFYFLYEIKPFYENNQAYSHK